MTGPCMCGDPYCGSCGDPTQARWEAFVDALYDKISDFTEDEAHIFVAAGEAAVNAVRSRKMVSPGLNFDYDPTPYCIVCGAMTSKQCNCGPYAENH